MSTKSVKMFAAIAMVAFAESAFAANHDVEAASEGRMLNLRTVYPSVGDTVTLPAAEDGCSYVVGNTNIAEMVGANVMKILAPGATSVAYYTGSSVAEWNDCAEVTVPPTPKGFGSVYVWTRTDGGNWNASGNWTCVRGPGNSAGYPSFSDDVAMVFVNGQRKWTVISVNADVTVGALWTGSVRHQYSQNEFAVRFNGPNTLTFSASDGEAELNVLGSATYTSMNRVHTLGYSSSSRLPVVLASSLKADFGYASGERICISRDFARFANVDMTINEGCTLLFQNINPANIGAVTHTIEFTTAFTVTGAGTIVNDSAATVYKGGDWSAFTGTYIEQGCGHNGYHSNGSNANLYQAATNSPFAMMVVRGFPQIATTSAGNTFRGYLTSPGNFAGLLRVAGAAAENPGNRLNYAEVDLQGGFIDIRCDAKAGWLDPVLRNAPGKLVVKEGFSGIMLNQQTTETYPTNILEIANLSHENGAMLSIREPMSDAIVTDPGEVRGWVTIGNFAEHAIGGSGDVVDSDADYKIIPWLVSPTRNRTSGDCRFYGADAEGRIMVPVAYTSTDTTLDSYSEHDNAVVNGGTLSFDSRVKTVNSLHVRNMGPSGNGIPAGKRLTVTSGGVLLTFQGFIGTLGASGDEAGELYFPSRGYVWDVSTDDNAWKHGQIWDKIIAPHGVSFAAVNHNGARIYLGGDQTGINGDITLNCGMLSIGADAYGSWAASDTYKGTCKLRDGVEIRVVGATSTLEIPHISRNQLKRVKVVLRDMAGHKANISIPDANTVVPLKALIVRKDDGTEIAYKPGVYAGSAGEGVDYVDDHIKGEGRIKLFDTGFCMMFR